MTALDVITLLRSLHRPTTWHWDLEDEYGVCDQRSRQGCATCHKDVRAAQSGSVSWPCETAALLDQIEATLQ